MVQVTIVYVSINSSWMICPSYSQFHNLEMFSVVPSGEELLPHKRMWLSTGETWSGEFKEKKEREKGREGMGGKQRRGKTKKEKIHVCVLHTY